MFNILTILLGLGSRAVTYSIIYESGSPILFGSHCRCTITRAMWRILDAVFMKFWWLTVKCANKVHEEEDYQLVDVTITNTGFKLFRKPSASLSGLMDTIHVNTTSQEIIVIIAQTFWLLFALLFSFPFWWKKKKKKNKTCLHFKVFQLLKMLHQLLIRFGF